MLVQLIVSKFSLGACVIIDGLGFGMPAGWLDVMVMPFDRGP